MLLSLSPVHITVNHHLPKSTSSDEFLTYTVVHSTSPEVGISPEVPDRPPITQVYTRRPQIPITEPTSTNLPSKFFTVISMKRFILNNHLVCCLGGVRDGLQIEEVVVWFKTVS